MAAPPPRAPGLPLMLMLLACLAAAAAAPAHCHEVNRLEWRVAAADVADPDRLCTLHVTDAGGDREVRDPLLYIATAHGHGDAVRVLLAAGAAPDLRGHFQTPQGPLFGHTATDRAPHVYLFTPLQAAARYGQADTVALLLRAGADPALRVQDLLPGGEAVDLEWTAADLALSAEVAQLLEAPPPRHGEL